MEERGTHPLGWKCGSYAFESEVQCEGFLTALKILAHVSHVTIDIRCIVLAVLCSYCFFSIYRCHSYQQREKG